MITIEEFKKKYIHVQLDYEQVDKLYENYKIGYYEAKDSSVNYARGYNRACECKRHIIAAFKHQNDTLRQIIKNKKRHTLELLAQKNAEIKRLQDFVEKANDFDISINEMENPYDN